MTRFVADGWSVASTGATMGWEVVVMASTLDHGGSPSGEGRHAARASTASEWRWWLRVGGFALGFQVAAFVPAFWLGGLMMAAFDSLVAVALAAPLAWAAAAWFTAQQSGVPLRWRTLPALAVYGVGAGLLFSDVGAFLNPLYLAAIWVAAVMGTAVARRLTD